MTSYQIKILSLIAPYPMGTGKSYKEAAEELGCSEENIKKIISSIKRNSPEVYEKLQKCRALAQKDRELLKPSNMKSFDVNESIKIRNKF